MPKISVLMPIYNTDENHLRYAIQSILNQTYKDFEFLILNDNSSKDNLEKIVKSYNDKRIKYYKNDENLGISDARNRLMELAQGEYLAIMDHDDISLPERIEKQVNFLDKNQDYGIVGSWHNFVNNKKIAKLPVEDEIIQNILFTKCCICHPATMIRKSVLIDNKLKYEKSYSPSEDYRLWSMLVGKTKFYNIPEVLFSYRDYENNTTHKQKEKMFSATYKIQKYLRYKKPELWISNQDKIIEISKVDFLGFIPLITTKSSMNKSVSKLFGIIPFLSKKTKIIRSKK